uniref:IrrE N-terminal-like domain-containing protein n=1 Tax=uncultured Thiotrichaceae bacterium TaxID=298394 RepID=A0A6S6UEP0_9GAMM|nr:MAG: Unknown protein [uncultured Thiotrichaceae bacterium]
MFKLNILRLIFAFGLLLPLSVEALTPSFTVSVESKWGKANPKDVKAVLDSVGTVVAPYIGGRTLDNIIVRNAPKGPISLYQRGENGEYIVLLDVKGRYWSQLAYQYSHEICHLLSNYDLAPNNITQQQWFEESLCEAFSLFTLKQMAIHWEESPPYPNWKSYAPELRGYADRIQREQHRQITSPISAWYKQQQKVLEENPYAQDRKLNEKMATALLEIFEANPENWAAMNYLNLGEDTGVHNMQKYMSDWYRNAPDAHQKIVVKIQQLLDVPH